MRRCLLLCAAALAAACGQQPRTALPPAIGESRDLALVASGDLVPGAPLGTETRQLAVAAGRSSWLVVWSRPGGAGEDLVGLRVSASGAPLDPSPFVISGAAGDEQSPAVAFDGERWLVVWQDHRVGPLMNIYAARVAEDGTVLDPAGIPVCTQDDHQKTPVVAVVDGVFLVVWADHRAVTEWDIYGSRVTRDGAVLDGTGFAVSTASGHQVTPAIAVGGGVALAVWQDGRTEASIYGARIAASGAVLDAGGIPVAVAAGIQAAPAAAFDGAAFTVAWQDQRAAVEPDVYAARVTPAGEVLDDGGLRIVAGPLAEMAPAATYDGRHSVLAWAAGAVGAAALEAARLDGSGTLQDDPPFSIATGALGRSLALAGDGEGRVLAVHDALDGLGGVTLRGRVLTTWARLDVVRAGRGSGTVTSAPSGLECGAACSAVFDGGAAVTLAATPDADSVFGGWSGPCEGVDTCTVTMDAAKTVTATFLPLLAVDVTIGGAGGTVISAPAGLSCPGTCSARFPEGTVLRLAPGDAGGVGLLRLVRGLHHRGRRRRLHARRGRAEAGHRRLPPGADPHAHLQWDRRGVAVGRGATCAVGATCRVDVALGAAVSVNAALEYES